LNTIIYVGNIPYDCTADDLRDWFSDFGMVIHARIVADRATGHSRGFGFVQMTDGADNAINALNGFRVEGRRLAVNEDQPRRRNEKQVPAGFARSGR